MKILPFCVVLALFWGGCESKSETPTNAPAGNTTTAAPAKSLANASPPPQRWALLIHHARSYKPVLVKHYGWDEKNIIIVDNPKSKKVAEAFAKIPELNRDDLFLFSSCHHAAARYLFNKNWPWRQVEKEFKRIGATNIVILEVCHGGLAMEHLPSSDVVVSAVDAFGKCGGIFKGQYTKALTNPDSDANGDGYITLYEAFDVASNPGPLRAGYKNLRKKKPKFWPVKFVPTPVRSPGRRGYQIHLGPNWDLARQQNSAD
jgi:hypothetical protein